MARLLDRQQNDLQVDNNNLMNKHIESSGSNKQLQNNVCTVARLNKTGLGFLMWQQ